MRRPYSTSFTTDRRTRQVGETAPRCVSGLNFDGKVPRTKSTVTAPPMMKSAVCQFNPFVLNKNPAATAPAFPPAPTIPLTEPNRLAIDKRHDGIGGAIRHFHEQRERDHQWNRQRQRRRLRKHHQTDSLAEQRHEQPLHAPGEPPAIAALVSRPSRPTPAQRYSSSRTSAAISPANFNGLADVQLLEVIEVVEEVERPR